jgi:hypothetical protein
MFRYSMRGFMFCATFAFLAIFVLLFSDRIALFVLPAFAVAPVWRGSVVLGTSEGSSES